jgi:hypothetical protein
MPSSQVESRNVFYLQVSLGFVQTSEVVGRQLQTCGMVGNSVLLGLQDAIVALDEALQRFDEGEGRIRQRGCAQRGGRIVWGGLAYIVKAAWFMTK